MVKNLNRNVSMNAHDALVLVHPTYTKVKRPDQYPHRLLDAVDLAIQNGKPVFVVPDNGVNEWLLRHLGKRNLIPVPYYLNNIVGVKGRVLRRRLQREVDFIAGVLSKKPNVVRLGFGGMYAAACVFGIAHSWCRDVTPWWPDWEDRQLRKCLPRRPIAAAEVLEELVVGFDEEEHVLP